jgi:hypothetical protein
MSIEVGDLVRTTAAFSVNGTATDPTTIVCKVKPPSGSTTTYTYGVDVALVKDSTGNYHLDFSITLSAQWWVKWVGTGACQKAHEVSLNVPIQYVT